MSPPSCFTLDPKEVDQLFKCLAGIKVSSGYGGTISRYLDTKKKMFSGMKSHDCHVRETLTDLCHFFDAISQKSISVKQLHRLQEEIVVILNELEM